MKIRILKRATIAALFAFIAFDIWHGQILIQIFFTISFFANVVLFAFFINARKNGKYLSQQELDGLHQIISENIELRRLTAGK
jgi:hypothetical protein